MIKAVVYARYSSHNQREESIEGQLRKCREFAEQNGFVIIEEYCDRAMTGKNDNRENFQRMMRDSDKGLFQAVIMYTLDRFARNRYDSAMYKAKLKKNGIKLYYTEQSITDEPEGIILESVLEGMAEYYSENLSRGVRRGMKENALKCMINGGYMPLGYRKTADKKYEIDPVTAPIVREIFDLYASGKTQRQIVDILNGKGYRTVKGKPFVVGSMSALLQNRKYIGIYSFHDIEIKDGIPAIIDEKTFNKVQEMMKHNKRTSGRMKAPAPYLLTGKLYCGHCGSTMVGESGTSASGTIYNYYSCSDRKHRRGCAKKNERKDWIEKLVVEETISRLMDKEIVANIAHEVARIANKEFEDKSRLTALQSELQSVQTSIRNLLRLVEKGIDTDDVGDRLLDLNSQKADLQKQIIREENKKPLVTEERIVYWLTQLLSDGDINDIEYQRRIIDTLVNKVFIFDNDGGGKKIVITYNTSNNIKSTITLSDIMAQLNSSDIDCSGRPYQIPLLIQSCRQRYRYFIAQKPYTISTHKNKRCI